MTATLSDTDLRTDQSADQGPASHIVLPPPGNEGESAQAYILRARVEGFPVTALCGYTWIPQRDPAPLPVCEVCLAIYKDDPNGHGDRADLPDA